MAKRLTGMPKKLYVGRRVSLCGKVWTVQESYSDREFGSEAICRTVRLTLVE